MMHEILWETKRDVELHSTDAFERLEPVDWIAVGDWKPRPSLKIRGRKYGQR